HHRRLHLARRGGGPRAPTEGRLRRREEPHQGGAQRDSWPAAGGRVTKEARERDITVNRRAFHDYFIDERYEAGLVLTGSEGKSLRDHRAHLQDAFAPFFGDELVPGGARLQPF